MVHMKMVAKALVGEIWHPKTLAWRQVNQTLSDELIEAVPNRGQFAERR